MKKILSFIIVTTMLFIILVSTIYAGCEKINRENLEITEDVVLINVTGLMYDTQPVYGNGIYVQISDTANGALLNIPDRYKNAGFSNSPLYVYDKDLNCLKSIEFDGVVTGLEFIDGYFYFSKTIYGESVYDIEHNYYKSCDIDNWIEITIDEYRFAKQKVRFTNGMQYICEQYTYKSDDGSTVKTLKSIEYLIDNNGNKCEIEREDADYVSGGDKEATDINVYTLSKKNPQNVNDSSLITRYISLDGLSMLEIPSDANTNHIWNDKEYIYLGILKDDTYCYKIPITDIPDSVKIKCNNKYLSFATNPIVEDDRTLVPMRFLFEQMGAEVDWDADTQTATVKKTDDIVAFSIDDTFAIVNNEQKTMDVPARLINGKTMIPLRFLSEELGYTVEWDEQTRTAIISE